MSATLPFTQAPTVPVVVAASPLPTKAVRPTGTPVAAKEVLSAGGARSADGRTIPDFAGLEQYMLELINQDRQGNGLSPVEWDALAAKVGREHAIEMSRYDYLSHWNLAGQGPDIRYALAGGLDVVQENVYSYFQVYENGTPVPIQDWRAIIQRAEKELMDSPGHRKNILNPDHSRVGVGIAYNPATGQFRLSQEFINHYIKFDQPEAAPIKAKSGDSIPIAGTVLKGESRPLINLAYEPFPEPMTVEVLRNTDVYISPADILNASLASIDPDGKMAAWLAIPADGEPGYYHVRIWLSLGGDQIPAADILVEVPRP
jgi:uncharacterized protein YkwD